MSFFRSSSFSFTDRKGEVGSPIIGFLVDFMLDRSDFDGCQNAQAREVSSIQLANFLSLLVTKVLRIYHISMVVITFKGLSSW